MRVEYHPSVQHDVAEATRRYQGVSDRLGEGVQGGIAPRHRGGCREPEPVPSHQTRVSSGKSETVSLALHFPGRSGRDSRDARAASSAASEIRDGTGVGWLRQHDREWEAEAELDVSKLAGTLSVLIPNRRL